MKKQMYIYIYPSIISETNLVKLIKNSSTSKYRHKNSSKTTIS